MPLWSMQPLLVIFYYVDHVAFWHYLTSIHQRENHNNTYIDDPISIVYTVIMVQLKYKCAK
jgi:hypothetical protein